MCCDCHEVMMILSCLKIERKVDLWSSHGQRLFHNTLATFKMLARTTALSMYPMSLRKDSASILLNACRRSIIHSTMSFHNTSGFIIDFVQVSIVVWFVGISPSSYTWWIFNFRWFPIWLVDPSAYVWAIERLGQKLHHQRFWPWRSKYSDPCNQTHDRRVDSVRVGSVWVTGIVGVAGMLWLDVSLIEVEGDGLSWLNGRANGKVVCLSGWLRIGGILISRVLGDGWDGWKCEGTIKQRYFTLYFPITNYYTRSMHRMFGNSVLPAIQRLPCHPNSIM